MNLLQAKQQWAISHGKESWGMVKRDFSLGIGISKQYDFETVMDEVFEISQASVIETLEKVVNNIPEYITRYDRAGYKSTAGRAIAELTFRIDQIKTIIQTLRK